MFIVMHCMGIPFDGNTIKEKSLGGSETAAYYMAKELSAQGHKVTLFTGISEDKEGAYDNVRYLSYGQPNDGAPLGERFHFYAESTPHDVLIIQRHSHAFEFPYAAKLKYWWLHDLAMVRTAPQVQPQLWNINGVLTVSEFHKNQVCEVYGFDPDKVHAIQNGIDLDLFEGELYSNKNLREREAANAVDAAPSEQIKLLYTSRPERGLEHLVRPDGIMQQLAKSDDRFHLYVCGYSNTTAQMAPYYNQLWQSCEVLPNVTNLGSLTKQELADVMRQCDALVYPTPGPMQPNFEEVSCITAMECMAAGLPFISCNKGALAETCAGSGSILIELNKNGQVDIDKFVKKINWFFSDSRERQRENTKVKQLQAAEKYSWTHAATMVDEILDSEFKVQHSNSGSMLKELIRVSDFYAARYLSLPRLAESELETPIYQACLQEIEECYSFAIKNTWKEHYEGVYEREAERGVNYGPEVLDGNNRYEYVVGIMGTMPSSCRVMDYGCAHGHYTNNLAKRFPELEFIGIDIEDSNVAKARKWAEDEGLSNVTFYNGWINDAGDIELPGLEGETITLDKELLEVDAIIAAEVLEHVESPQHLVDSLGKYLQPKGLMILTTPFGPWEAQGYEEHWPWRAHVHHFERADLHDMFSHHRNFSISVSPSGRSKYGDVLGSYITTFGSPEEASKQIDYNRKIKLLSPQQTVSLCMIVHNAEETLLKCLNSVKSVVNEIILAIDPKTNDKTRDIIESFKQSINLWPVVKVIEGLDPLEVGFDEARNHSIEEASGDWIFWMDTDEELIHSENMLKYLQNNMYVGYNIKQHHFAVEPLGVMKTDLPCRLFRNNKGIKFFGVVHEHPEIEVNKGVGHTTIVQDFEIAHRGYTTEAIRKGRFNRNIPLMVRDREKYPTRKLGKFLWLRDLSQMCQYELQSNGGRITPAIVQRADEGIKLWEELLAENELRMLVDGIQFYSALSQLKGGYEFSFVLDASKMNGGTHLEQQQPIRAHFAKREHIDMLFQALTNEKVKSYGSKYF